MNKLEKAAKLVAENFGKAQNIYHPKYGQILKDGKPTKAGLKFYKKEFKK